MKNNIITNLLFSSKRLASRQTRLCVHKYDDHRGSFTLRSSRRVSVDSKRIASNGVAKVAIDNVNRAKINITCCFTMNNPRYVERIQHSESETQTLKEQVC